MKFSGRMNSFIFKGKYDLLQTIDEYRKMEGITHLEFNYPEHVVGYDLDEIKKHMGDLKVNGVALRFRGEQFVDGEFTNPKEGRGEEAVKLCLDAVDACCALGGSVVTIWLGYDGFDYPFQVDYERNWNIIVDSFRKVAEYAEPKGIKISIEYKPCEPRAYSMVDGIGLSLQVVKEVNKPNIGLTLDYCHMLMKRENPAYSLVLAAKDHKLYGLHMNDGYGELDNGLIFGSVTIPQALEFVYYLKKYNYDGVIFFDSFPVREEAKEEVEANIKTFQKLSDAIDQYGMDQVEKVIKQQDGVQSQKLVLDMLLAKK